MRRLLLAALVACVPTMARAQTPITGLATNLSAPVLPFQPGQTPGHDKLNSAFNMKADMATLFGPNWATMSPLQFQGALSPNGGVAYATPIWTDAVERTVNAHFSDSINVKDFGAVGDGATDSTAAFLAAISVATTLDLGATIVVPQGHYIVKQTLVATLTGDTGIHLAGAGIGETMVEFQIPSGASSYDGIDINIAPTTCQSSGCYNYDSPWRGQGVNGGQQGTASTIENLTLKNTGGPNYPAGSMISVTTAASFPTETALPLVNIQNVEGMTQSPSSNDTWVNGAKLIGVQNINLAHFFFDNHTNRANAPATYENTPGIDVNNFVAGAGVLVIASQTYGGQSQGVNLTDVQVGGFEAAFAVGGTAQGFRAAQINCASVGGGDEICLALGGGTIFDQGAAPHITVPGYETGGDYRVMVSSTSGITPGMQIVPVPSSGNQGGVPTKAIVDQVGSTATSGFYPISWTVPGEDTTEAMSGDTCVFTPASGSAFTATCSAAAASSTLTISSAGGTPTAQTGMIVTDTTHPAAIPANMEVWFDPIGTQVVFRLSSNPTYINQNPNSYDSAVSPGQYVFASGSAVVLDDPNGTGGITLTSADIGGIGIFAPQSPFDGQNGWPDIVAESDIQAQSAASPLNVVGASHNDRIDGWKWNNGSGIFLAATDDQNIEITNNIIDGNASNIPAIQLVGTTGAVITGNLIEGTSPLGSDDQTTNVWGANFWNGIARFGLGGGGTCTGYATSHQGCSDTFGGYYNQTSGVAGTISMVSPTETTFPAAAAGMTTVKGNASCFGPNNAVASWTVVAHYTVSSGVPVLSSSEISADGDPQTTSYMGFGSAYNAQVSFLSSAIGITATVGPSSALGVWTCSAQLQSTLAE